MESVSYTHLKKVLMAEEAERKKAIWDALEVGSVVKGVVRRLADFGAFVDIGGVDGLVHVTDLSWGRVQHPSDVVKVGDEIDVKILNVDPARERISLSYKQTRPRPWTVAGEKYPDVYKRQARSSRMGMGRSNRGSVTPEPLPEIPAAAAGRACMRGASNRPSSCGA